MLPLGTWCTCRSSCRMRVSERSRWRSISHPNRKVSTVDLRPIALDVDPDRHLWPFIWPVFPIHIIQSRSNLFRTPDPDSDFWCSNTEKNYQLKKIFKFFLVKVSYIICRPPWRTFELQKKPPALQIEHKIFSLIYFWWVIFAFWDPDLETQSILDLIEKSDPDPEALELTKNECIL